MQWWKVTVNSSGRMVSCEAVAKCCTDGEGNRVYYLQAARQIDAEAQAYQRYKASQREKSQARRVDHRSKGTCADCGEPSELAHCRRCLDIAQRSRERSESKKLGIPVAPLPPKSEAFAETRERRENQAKLDIIEQVHRAWCRCTTDEQFTAWLQNQIKTLKARI